MAIVISDGRGMLADGVEIPCDKMAYFGIGRAFQPWENPIYLAYKQTMETPLSTASDATVIRCPA